MSKSKRSLGPRLAVAMSCAAALIAMAGLTLVSPGIVSGGSNPGPDVIVFNVSGTTNHGSSGGFRGYSIGTTSCNLGNQPLWWCNDAGDTFCNVN